LEAIETFDHAIAQRAQRHPAFPRFQALPGAGPVFAPGCSSPSANNGNAMPAQPNCKHMRVLRR
jgi:hypothetical protein